MANKISKDVKFILGNIVLIFTYFISWVSFNGSAAMAASFIGWMIGSPMGTISPHGIIKALTQINRMTSLIGFPPSFISAYLLLLIPILPTISILMIILKKKSYLFFSMLGAVICLIFSLDAIHNAIRDPYMNATWGVFIAFAASIWMLSIAIKPNSKTTKFISIYDQVFKIKKRNH